MRSFAFCFIVAFFLFTSCESNKTNDSEVKLTPDEETTAKALVQGIFDDVWGGLDSTKILNYHTEDFIILENGEVWDNKRIKEYIRQALKRENRSTRINKIEYISIEKHGAAIQMAYHNMADFMQGDSLVGQAQWLESATVIPTSEGLRLHQMHSTWVPMKEK